jgi:hypothetical protein
MTKFLMAAVLAMMVATVLVKGQESIGTGAGLLDGVSANFERLNRAMAERGYR